MKYFVLSLMILASGLASAQEPAAGTVPYDAVKKQIIYTEVVTVPGATAAKLYARALKTLGNMYESVDQKIILKDPTNNLINLKCSVRVVLKDPKTGTMVPQKPVMYKVNLAFKEGKYKYEIYDFHRDKGGYKEPLEKWYTKDDPLIDYKKERVDEILAIIDADMKRLIGIMKPGMERDDVKVKEDW